MQARRRTALAAATVVAATALALSPASPASPASTTSTASTASTTSTASTASTAKSTGPDLVTTRVGTPPATVRQGGRFGIGAVVANKGRGPARASSLTFYLSRDRAVGAADLKGAAVPVKKIAPRKSKTVSGTVKVPGQASGKYWVIACADATRKVKERKEGNNCQVSKAQVDVDDDLHARLAGQLTFRDVGQTVDPETGRTRTWQHTATATIDIAIDGDQDDPTFASQNSSYQRAGTVTVDEEDANCVFRSDRTESGGGPLKYTGDAFTDDIFGYFTKTDLSGVRIGLFMRAAWSQTDTQTGQGRFPCEPFTRTTTGTGLDVSSIELAASSTTADAIQYRVESWLAEMGTTSDWDAVEGTLTLTLR